MESRDLGISLELCGSSRCPCFCMSLHVSQVKTVSLVSHSLLEELSSLITGLYPHQIYFPFSWVVIYSPWYELFSLLLSWPELLSSRQSPQTLTKSMMSIALTARGSIHFHTRLVGPQRGSPYNNVLFYVFHPGYTIV